MSDRYSFRAYCAEQGVPFWLADSLTRYVYDRACPGNFLFAVLCNDLLRAVSRADDEALAALRPLAVVLTNEVPIGIYGSGVKVERHLLK